jgi:hypothetical protein
LTFIGITIEVIYIAGDYKNHLMDFQGLLRVQGRPAVSYDDQGMVFAVAYGGHIRMFDARKFEKVVAIGCAVCL